MDPAKQRVLSEVLLSLVPADGTPSDDRHLRQRFIDAARAREHKASDAQLEALREVIVTKRVLLKGKGRGGPVRRAKPIDLLPFEAGDNIAKNHSVRERRYNPRG